MPDDPMLVLLDRRTELRLEAVPIRIVYEPPRGGRIVITTFGRAAMMIEGLGPTWESWTNAELVRHHAECFRFFLEGALR